MVDYFRKQEQKYQTLSNVLSFLWGTKEFILMYDKNSLFSHDLLRMGAVVINYNNGYYTIKKQTESNACASVYVPANIPNQSQPLWVKNM